MAHGSHPSVISIHGVCREDGALFTRADVTAEMAAQTKQFEELPEAEREWPLKVVLHDAFVRLALDRVAMLPIESPIGNMIVSKYNSITMVV